MRESVIERNEYATLSMQINAARLLDRQPHYYLGKTLFTVGMLALSIAMLFLVDNLWLQLLNAVFLAFVFGQIGFLGHDASHHQIFASHRKNELFSIFTWGLILGISSSTWAKHHNKHHRHPNHVDEDPDLELPVVAFFDAQAEQKRGFQRFMVKYQAYFLPFLFMLMSFKMHKTAIGRIATGTVQYPFIEGALVLGYYAWYLGLMFAFFPFWFAIVFLMLNHALAGLYLSSVFAPNHKGMPIIPKNSTLSYLRKQVLTARNVRPSPFIDMLYGGLNYQIEHHLYPNMPRNNLHRARRIVTVFCKRQNIPYHETGVVQSYREIFAELHRVSAMLRA